MDYSLLIGIENCSKEVEVIESQTSCENWYNPQKGIESRKQNGNVCEIYHLGIIDILTSYSAMKKFEHFFKALRYGPNQISTVDPKQYANRFLSFIYKEVIDGAEEYDYSSRNLPHIPFPVEAETFDEGEAINVTLS